jgi:1,2-diacylglycerol 3-alpha-glucosyltransferase
MRILIAGCTYFPALNGQAIFTANLAEGLARRGHRVMVMVYSDEGRANRNWINHVEVQKVESVHLDFIHPGSTFSPFPGRTVRRIFDTFHPDIVHIQDHYSLSYAVLREARRRGIKTVGSNHFMPENLAPYVPALSRNKMIFNRLLWQWMLDTYNQLDVATAQSKAAVALVRSQGLRVPVYPVSCGIDLGRFHLNPTVDRSFYRARYGIDLQRTVFLFVGRVDGEKRLDVLLRAMQHLQRDDIQLAIAGSGAAMNDLRSMADAMGLGERVRFTGFIPPEDLPCLLNSVDIFTMPSEAELLSIATLEAMACARPVLLADAVALPELATNHVNGYLFKPGDSEDLARGMQLLADQPQRWAEMGMASLEKARPHGLESTVRQYEMLYETLFAGASAFQSSNPIFIDAVS